MKALDTVKMQCTESKNSNWNAMMLMLLTPPGRLHGVQDNIVKVVRAILVMLVAQGQVTEVGKKQLQPHHAARERHAIN